MVFWPEQLQQIGVINLPQTERSTWPMAKSITFQNHRSSIPLYVTDLPAEAQQPELSSLDIIALLPPTTL